MGVPFAKAVENLDEAVATLFASDLRVRSVGITRHQGGCGYRAVRNNAMTLPSSTRSHTIQLVRNVPVIYVDTPGEVEPSAASTIPETKRQRPLALGLQIQNFDDSVRTNTLQSGTTNVGTLSCFVRLSTGEIALLSNNHVIAGENRGLRGSDRILQPGSGALIASDQIAVLRDFVDLQSTLPGVQPPQVVYNEVDAAIAELDPDLQWTQGYLSHWGLSVPKLRALNVLTTSPVTLIGAPVFKVGRTTGLTYGAIVDINVIVSVRYRSMWCWFHRSLIVEGVDGAPFSGEGDSGSLVVLPTGEILGIFYASNGTQNYVCPIDAVFQSLACTLA